MKRPPPPSKLKLRHRYDHTDVQCLLRRTGPDGVTYYGRVKRHGKVYLKKMGEDFATAKKALRSWLNGVEQKAEAAAAASDDVRDLSTWGHFEERYLTATHLDVSLAPKSKAYRNECVNRIKKTWQGMSGEDLAKRKVTTITQENCQRWATGIVGYHVTTYNNTVAVFKTILQSAVEAGQILVNPAGKLKRLGKRRLAMARNGETGEHLTEAERDAIDNQTDNGPRWYPSPEEFSSIVKRMREYKGACKAAADFAELLCYSGCRLSEANRLRWSDVEMDKNRLRVNGAKGRATADEAVIRYVPLLPALSGLLKRLAKREHQPDDKIATVWECLVTMQRACTDLKMPRRLDHHDLRHTFATRAVAAGVPVPIVSDWLGHKDGGALLLKTYRHENEQVSQTWAKKVKL